MWPALSWAVKDSAGSRKLSWYAMREAYRPRLLHFSGADRRLVIINDTEEIWQDQLFVVFLDEMGLILETKKISVEISAKGMHAINLGILFESNGYVVAQLGDIRTARRVLDKPIERINFIDCDIAAVISGLDISVTVKANSFIHEFSLLPELVAQDLVTVSAQRLTVLPNETVVIDIEASTTQDAQLIYESINEIAWSLNRLISSTAQ
jgi:beta-mannosidase